MRRLFLFTKKLVGSTPPPPEGRRITASGDVRITASGDTRVIASA